MKRSVCKYRWLSAVVCGASFLLGTVALAKTTTSAETRADSQQWKTTEDLWYILEIAGAKAGWMNSQTQESEGQIRTTSKTHMTIDRGSIPIEINLESSFIETSDGKPLSCDMEQKMAKQTMRSHWEFKDDHVLQTNKSGGAPKKLPLPKGEWLAPAAA